MQVGLLNLTVQGNTYQHNYNCHSSTARMKHYSQHTRHSHSTAFRIDQRHAIQFTPHCKPFNATKADYDQQKQMTNEPSQWLVLRRWCEVDRQTSAGPSSSECCCLRFLHAGHITRHFYRATHRQRIYAKRDIWYGAVSDCSPYTSVLSTWLDESRWFSAQKLS